MTEMIVVICSGLSIFGQTVILGCFVFFPKLRSGLFARIIVYLTISSLVQVRSSAIRDVWDTLLQHGLQKLRRVRHFAAAGRAVLHFVEQRPDVLREVIRMAS